MSTAVTTLPSLPEQAERLIALGVPEIAGVDAAELRAAADHPAAGELLALHPDLAPPSALARLLERAGKPGFVVIDMSDVDEFAPIPQSVPPPGPLYLLLDIERGDEMRNWSPDEALPALTAAHRAPLTLTEGIYWLLQRPDALERDHCFMTIGSRRRTAKGSLDARTPAIWISNGTGRDGPERREAPKVGWCWAGNRHPWLGFASAGERLPLPA